MTEKISFATAIASWLIDNTTLTFKQIGEFCGIHWLQVKAIADGDIPRMAPQNPVNDGLLSLENIKECEKNSKKKLELKEKRKDVPQVSKFTKGVKYIPMAKREDKPNAIAWLIKHYPEMEDKAIVKLIRTTTPTILAVKTKTHRKQDEIVPSSPVSLGLCSQDDLELAISKIKK